MWYFMLNPSLLNNASVKFNLLPEGSLEIHTFLKGIIPKVSLITRLEFDLAYYNVADRHVNHSVSKTYPNCKRKVQDKLLPNNNYFISILTVGFTMKSEWQKVSSVLHNLRALVVNISRVKLKLNCKLQASHFYVQTSVHWRYKDKPSHRKSNFELNLCKFLTCIEER